MSNQRFYIVRICVPESLILYLHILKELLVQSECPKGYFPIFLVIDRANIERVLLASHLSMPKGNKAFTQKYPELESYPNPKISPLLHIKKDSTNKTLRISRCLITGKQRL